MIAEKRLHHLSLIGLKPLFKCPPHRAPPRLLHRRHRRKGQHRRTRQVPGQKKPTRSTIGISRTPRGVQVFGKGRCQRLRFWLIQLCSAIHGRHKPQILGGLLASSNAVQDLRAPLSKALVHQAKVQQPLSRIVHNIQMHRACALKTGQQPIGPHPQRNPQLTNSPRAVRPLRRRPCHRRQMGLKIKPRHQIIGLRLQKRRLNAPFGIGHQLRHAPTIQQVRNQRGDKHRLAGARQPGHAQPYHRLKHACDGIRRRFNLTGHAVRK
mmetsp:Transcript_10727/g.17487  ORF Transcript_10727/g.17487 Transcript_10727/m.17487 type:complete len:266 (-) Transcript_10727:25-822(-)